jgi:hypothetical protein
VYIFTCYMRTKTFHEKLTCRLGYVKKINLLLKIRRFMKNLYLFIIVHKNIVFCETIRTHIDCRDIHVKFLLNFSQLKTYFFKWEEHMHSGAIKFPIRGTREDQWCDTQYLSSKKRTITERNSKHKRIKS